MTDQKTPCTCIACRTQRRIIHWHTEALAADDAVAEEHALGMMARWLDVAQTALEVFGPSGDDPDDVPGSDRPRRHH